jgi:hypothetical protein
MKKIATAGWMVIPRYSSETEMGLYVRFHVSLSFDNILTRTEIETKHRESYTSKRYLTCPYARL